MLTPQYVDPTRVAWHVSTRSASGGTSCVEAGPVADGSGRVAVRHSHHPHGRVIAYDRTAWGTFVSGIKHGEFDF